MAIDHLKPKFILSTDTLTGYWLDLIFDLAKSAGFDWLDLAIWKNYDAWNESYVKSLALKHEMPIINVQVSSKVNEKELNQALDICAVTWSKSITINAPSYFDLTTFKFITKSLEAYKKQNKDIKFAIINPPEETYLLPIPKYRFTNIVEIVKKYNAYLGLDISNIDETALDIKIFKKLDKFTPHISTIYFSDKTRWGLGHILPGDGTLKLESMLKELSKTWYQWSISLKINIDKKDLADIEKVLLILKKATKYLNENYPN